MSRVYAAFVVVLSFLAATLFGATHGFAQIIGADPAACMGELSVCTQHMNTYSFVSLTEGNVAESYSVARVTSAFGATLIFDLIYNSYNADTTRASIDMGVGFGWTHTYNDFLFTQGGSDVFRWRGDGRVTKYTFSNGKYESAPGYFETLETDGNGTFAIVTKHQTIYRYEPVVDHHSIAGQPTIDQTIYRLISITDRNNNFITFAYSNDKLVSISDTYGRRLSLAYNANGHLSTVTDSLGRTTFFTYDQSGALLTKITDPVGKTTNYIYNNSFQITSKTDRDGRLFSLGYNLNLPYSEKDGNGDPVYALSNTTNWSTDRNQLLTNQLRVYIPSTTIRQDGRGNLWQYKYDSNGFPLTIIAPDGATTSYTYDPATLQPASMTDANGHTSSFQYDSEGNLIDSTDANGNNTKFTYDSVFNYLTSMTDPNGRTTSYTYDGRGNRLTETDPLGHTASMTYDSHGNLLTLTDKLGNTTTYVYDGFGNRTTATDALSHVTRTTFDVVGNQTSVTDPNAHTTVYSYDRLNRTVLITNALGGTRQTVYDNEGDKVKAIDENGNTTTFAYDLRLRLVKITDAMGKDTLQTYDTTNNRLSRRDRNGHTTSYTYDSQNRLISTIDTIGGASSATYDGVGNKLTETDANGHTASYVHDALNRLTQRTDPLGFVTTSGYDLTGLPGCPDCTGPTLGSNKITKQVDGNGKVIYWAYDELDRMIIEIHKQGGTDYDITPNDAVTRNSFDANSNPLTTTTPAGDTTTYSYDPANRKVKSVNPTGDTTQTTFDGLGNVIAINEPNGNLTNFTYDARNLLASESDSAGVVTKLTRDRHGNITARTDGRGFVVLYTYDADYRVLGMRDAICENNRVCHPLAFSYDAEGNRTSQTDRNGKVTTYTWDALNRRVATTNPLDNPTKIQYDAVGNIVGLTDGNGHTTSYGYDPNDRRTAETYPGSGNTAIRFGYDATNHIVSRTDQKGQTTTFTYSDLYFLTDRTYPVSGNDHMTYDLSGRLLSATHQGWETAFQYDGASRVTAAFQGNRTVTYQYSIPNRERDITYPSGAGIAELRDARGRLQYVEFEGETAAEYTYDGADNLTNRFLGDGTDAVRTYNERHWTTSLVDAQTSMQGSALLRYLYSYDAEGNKLFEQRLHDPNHSEAYANNAVHELIDYKVGKLVSGVIQNPLTETTWDLDPVHNINSRTTDGVTETRTYSPANEITSINGQQLISDANGNLIDDGSRLYSYDEENRLIEITDKATNNTIAIYGYDALGRRVWSVDNLQGFTYYYYDAWHCIEEGSDANGALYVFGSQTDEVILMENLNGIFYFHQDEHQSVSALSDDSGKVVEAYQYDAYGYQTVILPGPNGTIDYGGDDVYIPGGKSIYGNPFMYTGQRYDAATGLLYYKYRYYSSYLARFLTRDPIGSFADPANLGNAYAYTGNDPTNATDPMGLCKWYQVGCWLKQAACKAGCGVTYAGDVVGCYATAIWAGVKCDTVYGLRVAGCCATLVAEKIAIEQTYEGVRFTCFLITHLGLSPIWCYIGDPPTQDQEDEWKKRLYLTYEDATELNLQGASGEFGHVTDGNWARNLYDALTSIVEDKFDDCKNAADLDHQKCVSGIPGAKSSCLSGAASKKNSCLSGC